MNLGSGISRTSNFNNTNDKFAQFDPSTVIPEEPHGQTPQSTIQFN
jgi:hypothetical protein